MSSAFIPCILLCAASCTDSGGDRTSEFIGTWQWAAGSTSTVDCDNKHSTVVDLSGPEVVAAGSTSDLVDGKDSDASPCMPVRLDVTGSTAFAQPGQSCVLTGGTAPDTFTTTTTFDDVALELDAAGHTLTPTGQAESTITGAVTAHCIVTFAGTLTR